MIGLYIGYYVARDICSQAFVSSLRAFCEEKMVGASLRATSTHIKLYLEPIPEDFAEQVIEPGVIKIFANARYKHTYTHLQRVSDENDLVEITMVFY